LVAGFEAALRRSGWTASEPEDAALVLNLIDSEAPKPLHNHGITVTGDSLPEILDRIEPRIRRQVPMA